VQFADLAFGKSEEADVGMQQSLINGGNILLIPTDPIERLGYDIVKPAPFCCRDKGLHARTIAEAAAADGIIGIDLDHRPFFLLDALSAEPDLVFDGGR
jgi:hypothetical protein